MEKEDGSEVGLSVEGVIESWVEPILLLIVSTLTFSAEATGSPEILRTPRCRVLGAIAAVVFSIWFFWGGEKK